MDGRKLDRCSRPAPSLYKSRHTDIAATLSAMCVQPQHPTSQTPRTYHAPPHIVPHLHLSSPHTSPIKAPLATTGHPRNCRRVSERGRREETPRKNACRTCGAASGPSRGSGPGALGATSPRDTRFRRRFPLVTVLRGDAWHFPVCPWAT